MIIVVYVDDILIMCRNPQKINVFATKLKGIFDLKDVGEKRCLGMDFRRDNKKIAISQGTYIRDILCRFNMTDCNPVSTPIEAGTRLTKNDVWTDADGNRPPYHDLVGCIAYLAIATRSDIAHAASVLSQLNDAFGKSHWIAAKRVLRYLKGTVDLEITYNLGENSFEGFVDADYAGSIDDKRSYTGYTFLMSGGAISWESRKQRTVVMSTTDAEYMALSDAAKEALHLQRFLLELEVKEVQTIKLYNDNFSAQKLAVNPVYHAQTKHIDILHHFIREVVESGALSFDVLTKALTETNHERCIEHLGLFKTPVKK